MNLDYSFNDNGEFNEFSKKIFSDETLIDSNVFLRAIILSIYFFDNFRKRSLKNIIILFSLLLRSKVLKCDYP